MYSDDLTASEDAIIAGITAQGQLVPQPESEASVTDFLSDLLRIAESIDELALQQLNALERIEAILKEK